MIHSWWVPSLGGKVDAVPGYTTYTWFKAPHTGTCSTASARSCAGANHAAMTAFVKVVTPPQYTAWLTQQAAGDPGRQRTGRASCVSNPDRERATSRRPLTHGDRTTETARSGRSRR